MAPEKPRQITKKDMRICLIINLVLLIVGLALGTFGFIFIDGRMVLAGFLLAAAGVFFLWQDIRDY